MLSFRSRCWNFLEPLTGGEFFVLRLIEGMSEAWPDDLPVDECDGTRGGVSRIVGVTKPFPVGDGGFGIGNLRFW